MDARKVTQAVGEVRRSPPPAGLENGDGLATFGDLLHAVWVARRFNSALTRPGKGLLTGLINPLRDGRRGQAPVFQRLGLDSYVVLGGATLGHGGTVTADMAATVYEALIAAIEIDGGREAAEAFLERAGGQQIDDALEAYRGRSAALSSP